MKCYSSILTTLLLTLILITNLVWADDITNINSSLARIEANLAADKIDATPIPGMYWVQLSPIEVVYYEC
jgi:hypothetical protein